MVDEIIAQLETGSIGNVARFGERDLPSPPYVCVKMEKHPVGRGIRLIAHENPSKQNILENYIFNESSTLLKGFKIINGDGSFCIVKDADEYNEVVADNDDGTISMERLFYVPNRLH